MLTDLPHSHNSLQLMPTFGPNYIIMLDKCQLPPLPPFSLQKHGVLEELCQLVLAEHMASSLKLLAIRAMDSVMDYPQGIERFLGWSGPVSSGGEGERLIQ